MNIKAPLMSDHYDDVYFSAQDGLQETRYVFLNGNDLENRFKTLGTGDVFTIAETGFGTGLNFLAAWHLFNDCAPSDACMHFISVEKFPLSKTVIMDALSHWSADIGAELTAMMDVYPDQVSDDINLSFDQGRVMLRVMIGDASDRYAHIDSAVHAWFLDGFKPSSNPDMWSDELFASAARLTVEKGTLATFTAAGFVRRGLQAAGFDVCKRAGFGRKREMVMGVKS